MTIDTFNILDLRSKLLTLKLRGQLLDEYITKSSMPYIILYYSLDKFFVQIVFNLGVNKITKVAASVDAKYLEYHSNKIAHYFESEDYSQHFEFTLKK